LSATNYMIQGLKDGKPHGPEISVHARRLRFRSHPEPEAVETLVEELARKKRKRETTKSYSKTSEDNPESLEGPAASARKRHKGELQFYGEDAMLPKEPLPQKRFSLPPRQTHDAPRKKHHRRHR
jgi:hypothetical protein